MFSTPSRDSVTLAFIRLSSLFREIAERLPSGHLSTEDGGDATLIYSNQQGLVICLPSPGEGKSYRHSMVVNLCAFFPCNSLTHHAAALALSINTPQRYRGRRNGCKDIPEYWTHLSPSFNTIYMGWCLHLSTFWTGVHFMCLNTRGGVWFSEEGERQGRRWQLSWSTWFLHPSDPFYDFHCSAPYNPHCYSYVFFPIQTWHIRLLHCLIYTLVRSVQLFFPRVLFLSVQQSCLLWLKHLALTTCPVLYAVLMAQSFIKSPGNITK